MIKGALIGRSAIREIKMSGRCVAAICAAALCGIALPPLADAQQKTVKVCTAEWKANREANRATGKTEKAYIAECRGGAAQTLPLPFTPASAAVIAPLPTAAVPGQPIPAEVVRRATSTAPKGANQFLTEAAAKVHCPDDTVIWANTKSKIYHFSDNSNYANTESGFYMCERDTGAAGLKAAQDETHP
jgi:hypothetical protein